MLSTFIKAVLSDQGYPIVALLNGDFLNHIIYQSKEELIDAIPQLIDDNQAVYFALATFSEYSEVTRSNPALSGYRTTEKVKAYRTLFTEVDIRPDKDDCYSSGEEAETAIANFCEDTGIPYPTVVKTGGGFHLYWVLQSDIDLEQWRTWSDSVIACAKHKGFKLDIAGTNKPTQIYRPPTSLNNKYEPAFEVSYDHIEDAVEFDQVMLSLSTFMSTVGIEVKETNKPSAHGKTSDEIPLRYWDKIESKCEQLRVAATGSEEHWRGMLSIARLCKTDDLGPIDLCHELSSADPRYSEADTDKKLYTLERQLDGTDGMPYSCAKFDQLNPDVCKHCHHYEKIKSPIVLGLPDVMDDMDTDNTNLPKILEAVVQMELEEDESDEDSHYDQSIDQGEDEKFMMTDYGLIMNKVTINEQGEYQTREILICKQRLFPIGIIHDTDGMDNKVFNYMWRVDLGKGQVNDAIVSADVFTTVPALVGMFSKLGVNIVDQNNFKFFAQAMRSINSRAREKLKPIKINNSMGWRPNEFIFGKKTVDSQGTVRKSVLNEEMRSLTKDTLYAKGTLEQWQTAVAPYQDEKNILPQIILGVGFGAPLVYFSAIKGVLISLVGESGCGKSTMQEVSASIWGNPASQLQNAVGTKTGDTVLSMTRWMGGLNSLPVHLEELSNMSDEDASDLAYLITQGSEKNRMQRGVDEGLKRTLGLTWNTLVTASSNESLRDKIARYKIDHTAEIMRILEISDIPIIEDGWGSDAQTLEGVRDFYGTAGEVYSEELMRRRDSLRDDLQKRIDTINRELQTSSPERFWIQGIACILHGIDIASDLGLFKFNKGKIKAYLYKQVILHREVAVSNDVQRSSLFADMLNEILGETLVVKDSGIEGSPCEVIRYPNHIVSARMDVRSGEVFISSKRMKKYSRDNKVSLGQLIDNAHENGYLESYETSRQRLGSGVSQIASTQIMVYQFKLPAPMVNHLAIPTTEDTPFDKMIKGEKDE